MFKEVSWAFFYTNDTDVLNPPEELPEQPRLYGPLIYRRNTDQIDSAGAILEIACDLSTLRPLHCRNKSSFNETVDLWKAPLGPSLLTAESLQMPYIPDTAFVLDKETFQKLNNPKFFDESYHTYWEDIDLSLRALNSQVKLQVLPEWALKQGVGKTCQKKSFYTQELFHRNRHLFKEKWKDYFRKNFNVTA